MQSALKRHYDTKSVGLGGVFVLTCGKARVHVMVWTITPFIALIYSICCLNNCWLLPRDAMQARSMPSCGLCLSHSCIVSKRLQIQSVAMECEQETIPRLSNGTKLNDREWLRTKISRKRHYLTLNISENVRDSHNSQWNRDLHMPYARVSFWTTLSDLEWFCEIFNDTKQRAASLQHSTFFRI